MKIENGVVKMLGLEDAIGDGHIVIPDGATEIAMWAFREQKSIKSVYIPDSVTTIGSAAFENCANLENVRLPKGLKRLDFDLFAGCRKLKTVENTEAVEFVITNAFLGCESLEQIEFGDALKTIDLGAFHGCSSLKTIKLPKQLINISSGAFCGCESLESVEMPKVLSSRKIAKDLFYDCSSLKQITLPENIESIDDDVFKGCSSLEKITIPSSVNEIGRSAFEGCASLKEVTIPDGVTVIWHMVFKDCKSLTKIDIPENCEKIGNGAFENCENLESISVPQSVKQIGSSAFIGCNKLERVTIPFDAEFDFSSFSYEEKTEKEQEEIDNLFLSLNPGARLSPKQPRMKYIYYSKDFKEITFSKKELPELKEACYRVNFPSKFVNVDENYKMNIKKVLQLKEQGKVKYIPQDYVLQIMPSECMEDFFSNGNDKKWQNLVKQCKFDTLDGQQKQNTLQDLFKLYYALGGFSAVPRKSNEIDPADYILSYVVCPFGDKTTKELADEVHRRFGGFELDGPYNPEFAKFFMLYYKDNPDFLVEQVYLRWDERYKDVDYMVSAHNQFGKILEYFPNKRVVTRQNNDRLTPELVKKYCSVIHYDNVMEGNEQLAEMIAVWGYSQSQFNEVQEIYNKAKTMKDQYVICADKEMQQGCVKFRVLEKDDPYGFVIGHLANCCQHIGNAGASCVDDGYTNPNAGFLVFERSVYDEHGELTGETEFLGQAYVWYDEKTKTVCYDNIEIPQSIINDIKAGKLDISLADIMDAVDMSADAVMSEMRKRGVDVQRVTTGRDYNKLESELKKRYKKEEHPIARNREGVYTDADEVQYILRDITERKQEKTEQKNNDTQRQM